MDGALHILATCSILILLSLFVSNGVEGSEKSLLTHDMAAIIGGADTCSACSAGWQSTNGNITGGQGECEHGPEHDSDCNLSNPQCSEITGSGDCECFACHGIPYADPYSLDCEPEIRVWLAYCGMDSTPADDCGTEVCDTEDDATGAVRQSRASVVSGGGSCSGSGGSVDTNELCGVDAGGGDGPRIQVFACVSGNCAGQGSWGNTKTGTRKKCA